MCDPYNEFYPTSAASWTSQILHEDRTSLIWVGRISVSIFHKYFLRPLYHSGGQTNIDHLLQNPILFAMDTPGSLDKVAGI